MAWLQKEFQQQKLCFRELIEEILASYIRNSILLFLWIYFLKDYVLQSVLWLYNCITIVIQTKDSSKTHVKETETEERIILDNKVTSSAVFSSFSCNLASSLILWSSQELFAKIGNHNTGWNKITLRSFRTWRIIFPDSNHLTSDIVHRTNDRGTEVLKVGFPPLLQNQMVLAVLSPFKNHKNQFYFPLLSKTAYLYQNNGVLFTKGILIGS